MITQFLGIFLEWNWNVSFFLCVKYSFKRERLDCGSIVYSFVCSIYIWRHIKTVKLSTFMCSIKAASWLLSLYVPAEVLWVATHPWRRALCLCLSYEIHATPQRLHIILKKKQTVCQTAGVVELRWTHIDSICHRGQQRGGGRGGGGLETHLKTIFKKKINNKKKCKYSLSSTRVLVQHLFIKNITCRFYGAP